MAIIPNNPPKHQKQKKGWVAFIFLLPALVALIVFRILPFVSSAYNSFFVTSIFNNSPTFSGLENYQALLESSQFLNSLKVTLIFLLIVNPFQILLALLLSVILTHRIIGGKLLRTMIFLPVAVPPAVTALVWGLALRPDGVINTIFETIGFTTQPFLTSPDQALFCIILMLSWAGIGYWMVFLIAGLKEIPMSHLEAAVIDGASWWTCFIRIILPMMRNTLAFVFVANTIANFTIFAHIQVLTKGGPSGSTDLIMYQIYRQVFQYGNTNIGSAATTILMLVILTFVILEYRILHKD